MKSEWLPRVDTPSKAEQERRHIAKRRRRRVGYGLLKHIPIWIAMLATLFPIYFAIISALKTNEEYLYNKVLPSASPTLNNFVKVMVDEGFFIWAKNSAILTVATVVLCLLTGGMAAFAFSQMRFVGRARLQQIIISLLVLPTIVLAIPLFVFFARLGMINMLVTVIIIYVGVSCPFTLFILTGFFRTVPTEIMDAARIDGCSQFQLLWYVLLPLTTPVLITVSIVNALFVWNEILTAVIFLQKSGVRTLMGGVSQFSRFGVLDVPLVMAGLLLATLPMIVIYVVGQQYFIRGLTAGALKG